MIIPEGSYCSIEEEGIKENNRTYLEILLINSRRLFNLSMNCKRSDYKHFKDMYSTALRVNAFVTDVAVL
jgi:hypothetical protein